MELEAGGMIWQNSLASRAWRYVDGVARQSVMASACRAFKRMLFNCAIVRFFVWILERDSATETSWYKRALQAVNGWLFTVGQALARGYRNCLLAKLLAPLNWRAACRSSRLAFSPRRAYIFLLALFLPIDALLRRFFEGSIISSYWDEVFLIVGLLLVVQQRMQKKLTSPATGIDIAMAFFLGVSLYLCFFNSPDLGIGIEGLRAVVQYMGFFYVLSRLIETRSDVNLFLYTFLLLGVGLALHGVYQYVVGAPMLGNWVAKAEADLRTRVYSIVGSPNIFGSILVLFTPVMFAMTYVWKKWWLKLAAWAATGTMVLACLFTFSRGAWLGMLLAVLLFAIIVDRRLLLLMGLASVMALAVPSIMARVEILFTPQFQKLSDKGGRSLRWDFGLELWQENNIWKGYGLGRFGGAVAMNNQVEPGMKYFYMDNYYLKTLVEMGLYGLISFAVLCLTGLFQTVRAMFAVRDDRRQLALPAAIFCGCCGVLLHCYFENIFEVPYMVAYFWALLAVASRLPALNRAEPAPID